MICAGCRNDFKNRKDAGCPLRATDGAKLVKPTKLTKAKPPSDFGAKELPSCYDWAGYLFLTKQKVF